MWEDSSIHLPMLPSLPEVACYFSYPEHTHPASGTSVWGQGASQSRQDRTSTQAGSDLGGNPHLVLDFLSAPARPLGELWQGPPGQGQMYSGPAMLLVRTLLAAAVPCPP